MKNKTVLKNAGVLLVATILVLTVIVMAPVGSAALTGPPQFSFNLETASGGLGNAGAEFDGTYFYSARWASDLIHRYDINGNPVDINGNIVTPGANSFSVPGVSGLKDLAYCPIDDHFYGGNGYGIIYEMDFGDPVTAPNLVRTITGSFQCRAIAFDSDLDLFYVSGWSDPVWMVDRTTGSVLPTTINLGTTTNSKYGFAYDNVCPGGPYLWVFDQEGWMGTPQHLYQWDLTSSTFTGVPYDVTTDFTDADRIAGGLFFTTEFIPGTATLGGCLQANIPDSDMMFCYKICDTPPPPSCLEIDSIYEGTTSRDKFVIYVDIINTCNIPISSVTWTMTFTVTGPHNGGGPGHLNIDGFPGSLVASGTITTIPAVTTMPINIKVTGNADFDLVVSVDYYGCTVTKTVSGYVIGTGVHIN